MSGTSEELAPPTCAASARPIQHDPAAVRARLPADVLVLGEQEEALVEAAARREEAAVHQHRRSEEVADVHRGAEDVGVAGQAVPRPQATGPSQDRDALADAGEERGRPRGAGRERAVLGAQQRSGYSNPGVRLERQAQRTQRLRPETCVRVEEEDVPGRVGCAAGLRQPDVDRPRESHVADVLDDEAAPARRAASAEPSEDALSTTITRETASDSASEARQLGICLAEP